MNPDHCRRIPLPRCPESLLGGKVVGQFLLVGLFLFAGCQAGPPPALTPRQELRVAAAANLKFAFDEIVVAFHKAQPQVQVKVTYGSSGNFVAQLRNQAPFDLFLSADVDYPAKLVAAGLAAPKDQFTYAIGQLVVWVPKASPLDLPRHDLQALTAPSVRKIAMANPRHAPYGRAAEAALKKAGLYEALQSKLVLGDNVEQAAHFVHTGAADVGFIPLSLALSPAMQEKGKYWPVPAELYPPMAQAGVVLAGAKEKEAAQKLRAFLRSETGQAILQRHGYQRPRE